MPTCSILGLFISNTPGFWHHLLVGAKQLSADVNLNMQMMYAQYGYIACCSILVLTMVFLRLITDPNELLRSCTNLLE